MVILVLGLCIEWAVLLAFAGWFLDAQLRGWGRALREYFAERDRRRKLGEAWRLHFAAGRTSKRLDEWSATISKEPSARCLSREGSSSRVWGTTRKEGY